MVLAAFLSTTIALGMLLLYPGWGCSNQGSAVTHVSLIAQYGVHLQACLPECKHLIPVL